jgi:hypothetical protein
MLLSILIQGLEGILFVALKINLETGFFNLD